MHHLYYSSDNKHCSLTPKSWLSSCLVCPLLLCIVVNAWRIGCIGAFPQNAYDLKHCKVAMEAVKKTPNHKTTPVQYTIWWLKPLNLFWVPILPLPHTSPWCISSSLFITIGRNSGEHYESAVPQDKVYSVEMGERSKWIGRQNRQTRWIYKTLITAYRNLPQCLPCIFALPINKDIFLFDF